MNVDFRLYRVALDLIQMPELRKSHLLVRHQVRNKNKLVDILSLPVPGGFIWGFVHNLVPRAF